MNENPNMKKKKKLNAIDYFIIAAVVLCLAGAALRMALGSDGLSLNSPVVMEDYVVSFKVENIRNSSAAYLQPEQQFYIDATGQYFGKISDSISVTPARFTIEDAEGNPIEVFAPENGDATRVDVTGTMTVSGYMSENGFLLDGTTALAVNKTLAIRSSYLYVTITVTDIVKAS